MHCHVLTPLKAPDDPVPSGDRAIAQMLIAALRRLGFAADVASQLNTTLLRGDEQEIAELREIAQVEVERILAKARDQEPSALVLTHNVYYRAPDLIGPELSRRLNVPYVVAAGSRAPKRATGRFAAGHRVAERELDAARIVFAQSHNDRPMLDRYKPAGQAIVDLPPFIDLDAWPPPPPRPPTQGPVRLISVGMMRPGRKTASYEALAAALGALEDRAWSLDIVGDGPGRADVLARFARFGERVTYHGRVDDRARLRALYAQADLFVWPAVREPFGMVFLEAQSQGLPCIAFDDGGVRDAVCNGETGILVPRNDLPALIAQLDRLLHRPDLMRRWRPAARRFVEQARSLDAALPIMQRALAALRPPPGGGAHR